MCCSVMQCDAVCCSVSQCVAACCSVLQYLEVRCSELLCAAMSCSVRQCVAACYMCHNSFMYVTQVVKAAIEGVAAQTGPPKDYESF